MILFMPDYTLPIIDNYIYKASKLAYYKLSNFISLL